MSGTTVNYTYNIHVSIKNFNVGTATTAKKGTCLVCGRPLRGSNKLIKLCFEHQPEFKKEDMTRRECFQPGCTRTPRDPLHLYCNKHSVAKMREQAKQAAIRREKPFLQGLDELERKLSDTDARTRPTLPTVQTL